MEVVDEEVPEVAEEEADMEEEGDMEEETDMEEEEAGMMEEEAADIMVVSLKYTLTLLSFLVKYIPSCSGGKILLHHSFTS